MSEFQSSKFKVQGSRFKVQDSRFKIQSYLSGKNLHFVKTVYSLRENGVYVCRCFDKWFYAKDLAFSSCIYLKIRRIAEFKTLKSKNLENKKRQRRG